MHILEELRLQASLDPLTGLGHHATCHAVLRSALSLPGHEEQVAVVMLDLDRFKAVNDRLGHPPSGRRTSRRGPEHLRPAAG